MLFGVKGLYGVHCGGAVGGQIAGEDGDDAQGSGYRGERREIGGPHPEENRAQKAGKDQRSRDTGGDAAGGEEHPVAQYADEDVAFSGTERDADADFVSALARGVGDDAVNAHRGQQQSQQSE